MSTKNSFSWMQLLVFGFINEYERQFKLSMSVPNEVKQLIFQFYEIITIVIKNGCGLIKVGFAGDNEPKSFPTIVGIPRHHGIMVGLYGKDFYIGNEAKAKRGILRLKYPIQRGIVTSWDDMEKIWDNAFKDELIVTSKGCNVLLTEKPLNPKANREKMTKIMFETFEVNGLYIAVDAMLALYASGRYTGIVMDCGQNVSHTVPIYEGYVLHDAVHRMDVGGRDLTYYMMRILTERGYSFTTSAERDIVKDLKEKLCYIAEYYDEELFKAENPSNEIEKSYKLPDGGIIYIGNERFRAIEPLFNPCLRGMSSEGIHKMLYESVMKCDVYLRKDMYGNIVLSGGCCNVLGMKDRVKKEITNLAPASIKVEVIDLPNKQNLAWIGGAMLSSQDNFVNLMITKKEYTECGAAIVHRKCF